MGRRGGEEELRSIEYLKDWHINSEFPAYQAYTTPSVFSDDWLNEHWDNKSQGNEDYRFCYMGMEGTSTPLHHDVLRSYSWSINIVGVKKWILIPPSEEDKLKDRFGRKMIDDVNKLDYDVKEYPNLGSVTRVEVIQRAGETIFVPSGWFHQVINLDHTISINHNWFNGYAIGDVQRYIMKELALTRKEIRHLCATESTKASVDMEWELQCQFLLRLNIGMDLSEWITLLLNKLKTVAGKSFFNESKILAALGEVYHDPFVFNGPIGATISALLP